jgi:hypothetical protein
MRTDTDLLGDPLPPLPVLSEPVTTGPRKAAVLKWRDDGMSRLLFDALEYLSAPLLSRSGLPEEFRSTDRREVPVRYDMPDDYVCSDHADIQHVPWGPTWIESMSGDWSSDALRAMQYNVFWESMEELSLEKNEMEKWDVLKWIFMPAIRKYYVYSPKLGRSHCLAMHENDYAFSFHLCCMASRIEEEDIREGVIRNIHPDLHKAVMRVCTF